MPQLSAARAPRRHRCIAGRVGLLRLPKTSSSQGHGGRGFHHKAGEGVFHHRDTEKHGGPQSYNRNCLEELQAPRRLLHGARCSLKKLPSSVALCAPLCLCDEQYEVHEQTPEPTSRHAKSCVAPAVPLSSCRPLWPSVLLCVSVMNNTKFTNKPPKRHRATQMNAWRAQFPQEVAVLCGPPCSSASL